MPVVIVPVEVHGSGAGLGEERLDVIVVDPRDPGLIFRYQMPKRRGVLVLVKGAATVRPT